MRTVPQADQLIHRGLSYRCVKDNGTQVLSETGGVGSYISPAVGRPEVVDLVIAEGGPNRVHVLSDITGAVPAGSVTQLGGTIYLGRSERCRAMLNRRAVDGSREAAAAVIDEKKVVHIHIGGEQELGEVSFAAGCYTGTAEVRQNSTLCGARICMRI